MDILIAGISGFIGQALGTNLASGNRVHGVDLREPDLDCCGTFETIDLLDRSAVDHMMKRAAFDEIYVLAADTGGLAYQNVGGTLLVLHNLEMLSNLASACRPGQRILYCSSAWASACEERLSAPDRFSPALPASAQDYAMGKLLGERLLARLAQVQGAESRIARLHNVFGPGAPFRGGREGIVGSLCREFATQSPDPIRLSASPRDRRSLLYIDDCVAGMIAVMRGTHSVPIELGSKDSPEIQQLVRELSAISRSSRTVEYGCQEASYSRSFSAERLPRTLGWSAATPLHLGLSRTYEWVSRNLEI